MKTIHQIIDPEIARRYLGYNTANRRVKSGVVERYARDMESGNWLKTHEGIAFSEDGELVDGQHRLLAVIKSGKNVGMTVTTGIPKAAKLVIDQGSKREAHDSIRLAGRGDYGSKDVAAARILLAAQKSGPRSCSEIANGIEAYIDGITWARQHLDNSKVGPAPVMAALALAYHYEPDKARLERFCQILRGVEMPTGMEESAPLKLRESIFRDRESTHAEKRRKALFGRTLAAIKAFMAGKATARIQAGKLAYRPLSVED
jgi:hypothetical protein